MRVSTYQCFINVIFITRVKVPLDQNGNETFQQAFCLQGSVTSDGIETFVYNL